MASTTLPAPGAMNAVHKDHKIRFEYAVGIAFIIEIAVVAGLAYLASRPQPPQTPPKVIAVHMVAPPPKPKPPPPKPKPVPPPPKPIVHPKPVPKPPPIHHPVVRHVPKPITPPPPVMPIAVPPPPTPTPAPVVPAPVAPPTPPTPKPPPPAPAPPPEVTTGIAPYGAGARSLIQNNLVIGPLIKRLGLQGTVTVSFRVHPAGGKPYAIKIVGGSDNPLIRKAAMAAINATSFPPFRKDMPQRALTFTVPIQIATD